jgi:hypothetical protein
MASIPRDDRTLAEVGPRFRDAGSTISRGLAMSDVPGTERVEPIGDRRIATGLGILP